MTDEEIYAEYAAFVEEQVDSGNYDTIPHCDSRILHSKFDCLYCSRPEWQQKRADLGIALTGYEPLFNQISCPADAARPPGGEGDHRRWGGNRPTSVERDDPSYPEESFASRWLYGAFEGVEEYGESQPT
jgi:hypothetical protein